MSPLNAVAPQPAIPPEQPKPPASLQRLNRALPWIWAGCCALALLGCLAVGTWDYLEARDYADHGVAVEATIIARDDELRIRRRRVSTEHYLTLAYKLEREQHEATIEHDAPEDQSTLAVMVRPQHPRQPLPTAEVQRRVGIWPWAYLKFGAFAGPLLGTLCAIFVYFAIAKRLTARSAARALPVVSEQPKPSRSERRRNLPAALSLGLSLVGLWIPFAPLVALVLGHVGLIRSKRDGGTGRTSALIGLTLSYVQLVALGVMLFFALKT